LASREATLQQLGLFIIATNEISDDVDMDCLLNRYKANRMLKSTDFLTSAIYNQGY
jgi:hypothetical protein